MTGLASGAAISIIENAKVGAINVALLEILVELASQQDRAPGWLLAGEHGVRTANPSEQIWLELQKLAGRMLKERGESIPIGLPAMAGGGFEMTSLIEPGYRVVDVEQIPFDWPGKYVPIVGRLAAGESLDVDTTEAESTPPGWTDQYVRYEGAPPMAVAARVVGDSMEPTYHDGDMIIADPDQPVRSGICCVMVQTEAGQQPKLKRLRLRGEEATLTSLNRSHEPVTMPAAHIRAFKMIDHLPLLRQRPPG